MSRSPPYRAKAKRAAAPARAPISRRPAAAVAAAVPDELEPVPVAVPVADVAEAVELEVVPVVVALMPRDWQISWEMVRAAVSCKVSHPSRSVLDLI